jgi:hypothetical protein
MIKEIASIKETSCFVMREAVAGELETPTASDILAIAGTPTAEQMPETMESPEIFSSLSILERCKTQQKPGTWSIPIVLHSAGAAGTAPAEDLLIESLTGLKTVNAGTSVEYSPALGKKSLSIWYKVGHTVFFLSGVTVDKGDFNNISPATDCYLHCDLSGKFMRRGWCGSAEMTAAISGSTVTVGVLAIERYTVGGLVSFEDADGSNVDDNSGAGYPVATVNYTAGTFTVTGSPTYAGASGHVKAFLPDATITSTALPAKYLQLNLNSAFSKMVSVSVSFEASQFYPEDEATESGYPETYTDGDTRAVTCTINAYFAPEHVGYLKTIEDNTTIPVSIKSDTTKASAGERIEFYAARFRVNSMTLQEAAPVYKCTITGTLDGTTGEDELSIIYS